MTLFNRLELLTSYVTFGLSLVPIPPGAKCPKHKGWNRKDASITTAEAVNSISGNVGLAHAYCTPTPTAALDVDDIAGATDWFSEHSIDLSSLITARNAVTIDSGRPNRAKIIYRLPTGVTPIPSIKLNGQTSRATIFELRCATKNGKTVQDVLPPSIHPDTGKPYLWGGNGHFSQLPQIPEKLLKLWNQLLHKDSQYPYHCPPETNRSEKLDSVTRALLGEPETPRRVAIAKDMLRFINADCDYDTYRNIVWAVADTGWSCTFDLLREWSLTAPHRYNESALVKLLENFRYAGGIHYGTLIHYAKQGGWHE